MTIEQINARLAEIRGMINTVSAEQLTELEEEVNSLLAQRNAITEAAQRRNNLVNRLIDGEEGEEVPQKRGGLPVPHQHEEENDPYSSPVYRSAWLSNLQGKVLTAEQRAAMTTSDTAALIPTTTYRRIIEKIESIAPLLREIFVIRVAGNISFPVAGTNKAATKHSENAKMTPEGETLTTIELSAYEVTKLVQISESAKTMSLDDFEAWLVDRLAKSLAKNVNAQPIFGTGSGEGTGIENSDIISWADNTNQVTVASSATLTAADVLNGIGMLPQEFDENAKFVMSKRTFFTAFLPLQDKNKHNIVTVQGKDYFIQGYPVIFSDNLPLNDAYLGDWSTIYANMPQNMSVKSGFELDTNSYKYLGVCMFDCKPTRGDAFVKFTKSV